MMLEMGLDALLGFTCIEKKHRLKDGLTLMLTYMLLITFLSVCALCDVIESGSVF